MMQFTHAHYDTLERAITDRRRIAIVRRGMEYIVVPAKLVLERGREAIQARHPGGSTMTFYIDELEAMEVVK